MVEFDKKKIFKFLSRSDADFESRWSSVSSAISATGSYDLELGELEYGARMAWRNAARCVGRRQWKNLKLVDCRYSEMFLLTRIYVL